MEFGYDIIDFIKLTDGKNVENITPHKIAVIAFIREFGLLRQEAKEIAMFQCTMSPKYRKDFCMLALKLIQCPDMEFEDLEALLTNGKFNLLSVHLQYFCKQLKHIYENGVSALVDCINSTLANLMTEPHETSPCLISRNSVLGLYLRRMMLYLGKLSFEQVSIVYKSFCLYYQKGRPGVMVRSLSKDKLNNPDNVPTTPTSSTSPTRRVEEKHDFTFKIPIYDKDNTFEECQWSRKQAELFVAQQASLLQNNESKALQPKQLQKMISQIINDIPDYADVHFLSFLNCLRSREFCGAQDALFEFFDRSICASSNGNNTTTNDRSKGLRYAALNLAGMYTHFGYKEASNACLKEALMMSRESGDTWCANVAQHSHQTHLNTQRKVVTGYPPASIFKLLSKSEGSTFQHSMSDMLMFSLANCAAMWSLYGKTEMCSMYCQLLLNLYTKNTVSGSLWDGGLALAGVCNVLALHGIHTPPITCSSLPNVTLVNTLHRTYWAIYSAKWDEASQYIDQLSSMDRWHSQLLKAELYYHKGEPINSMESLNDIIDYCLTEEDSLHFMSLRIKAMILKAQVETSNTVVHSMNSSNILLLNEALGLSRKYYLFYLAAICELNVANVQLKMGCVNNALDIVKRVLPTVMANGGAYDMARAMLLYTKCRVAASPISGNSRKEVLLSCCNTLEDVKDNFNKVGAQGRLKETLYLQAKLYNEVGYTVERNQCALSFRQLDLQHPGIPIIKMLTAF